MISSHMSAVFLICCLTVMSLCASCSEMETLHRYDVEMSRIGISLGLPVSETRAIDPDEMRISDINIFIFNEYGILEGKTYITGIKSVAGNVWEIDLVKNGTYSVYACANFGYSLNIDKIDDIKKIRYYLAYPDDYSIGMPMSGTLENTVVTGSGLVIPLERLMAKIKIKVDRSKLDPDVEFKIRSIQVEGCPRSVYPFRRNHISDPFDFFPSGFLRKDYETDILNTTYGDSVSGEVCLYMLENMQGDLLPGNKDETQKVLPENGGQRELCSYIEIKSEYLSDTHYSEAGKYLVYRFYPGNDPGNFDVCRNTEYNIRITPKNSGLNGTEWRIDKSGIGTFAKTMELSYSSLSFSYIGEKTVIRPYITPGNADNTRLYWDSTDKTVATVSGDGEVTATGEGKCSVVCYAADGSGCSAECSVTVTEAPYYMKIFPGNFIRCRKGDIIQVECDYFPPDTPFDIGLEELEYDKERGIYEYGISEDGKTVTLYTKERGSGMLYMETGYPLNQAEMILVVID